MVLFGLLLAGFAGLIIFSYDKVFQLSSTLALVCSYIAWGIVHHHLHRDLRIETIIEYMVVAILGLVMVFSILIRT